jgi:predicted flap endonuclease-1-like 5' DNA nuclease
MQKNKEMSAIVISPSRNVHFRKGRGFSLEEIHQAGRKVNELRNQNIPIDFLRKSAHKENIDVLVNLKLPKSTSKKREPFKPKEKRRTEFKPKAERTKVRKEKVLAPEKVRPVVKPAPIKETPKVAKAESTTAKGRMALTELSGLGPTTEKKFNELGVNSIEELLLEEPSELGQLIKGCTEDRIKKWIEEGKELVKK